MGIRPDAALMPLDIILGVTVVNAFLAIGSADERLVQSDRIVACRRVRVGDRESE